MTLLMRLLGIASGDYLWFRDRECARVAGVIKRDHATRHTYRVPPTAWSVAGDETILGVVADGQPDPQAIYVWRWE